MPEIDTYAITTRMARQLRRLNKFGGHLADHLGTGVSERAYTGFGNGTGYTIGNWISDGVFPNLAAVQAAYPIVQDGNDTLDWALLQTGLDDTIYGSLGNSVKGSTRHLFQAPAGKFDCNRPLHIGYGRVGTPPASLNGNGYISITFEGEGLQYDASGNGVTGTTINFTSQCGVVIHGNQHALLRGMNIQGPYANYYANYLQSILRGSQAWNRDSWKPTGIADENWLGGAAVSVGVGVDLYTSYVSAAAYPARPLPAAFGGGTTMDLFNVAGGTGLDLEHVQISGFIINLGRPHGDQNAEFIRMRDGNLLFCAHAFVSGHSQGRNNELTNVNVFGFHSVLCNRGGTITNGNMHGTYLNVHAGYGYQWFDHDNSGWSGPLTLRDWYGEGVFRIGTWGTSVKLDGCHFSCWEIDALDGVAPDHFACAHLTLDNCNIFGIRHGLIGPGNANGAPRVSIINGTTIYGGWNTIFGTNPDAAKITQGLEYMGYLLSYPGLNARINTDNNFIGRFGQANNQQGVQSPHHNYTYFDQEFADFQSIYPGQGYYNGGTPEMEGSVQRFPVPKITYWQKAVTVTSRSGAEITCPRINIGAIKADIGDLFMLPPSGANASLKTDTWFTVSAISGSDMILTQLNNFTGDSRYDYQDNGRYQIAGGNSYAALYICTRIRKNGFLWVGDVADGSAVISNVKSAHTFGATDNFNDDNCDMAVGDIFLHQEINRANTGGSGLSVQNPITAIDYTANTITLTNNFNIAQDCYPVVFYVKVYNA